MPITASRRFRAFLYGVNPSAARTAIKRSQTVADADTDTQYGLSIQNTLIWGFDTAIDVTTMRNLWVTNSVFPERQQLRQDQRLQFRHPASGRSMLAGER